MGIRLFVIIIALIQIAGVATGIGAEEIRLPKGTQITLQMNDTLSTASNMEGDKFTASVVNPVSLGGRVAIPKGSVVTGSVSRILRADRLKGKAILDLMFHTIRVTGHKPADIAASLTPINSAGSGAKQSADNFTDRDKPASGSGGSENSNVRVQTSGGLPSVFNSKGDDAIIPRGAYMEITLDKPLILISGQ